MKQLIFLTILFSSSILFSQGSVGIGTNTPDASAILDVHATGKGMLTPRLNSAARDAMSAPATGLLIFNTDINLFEFYTGSNWTTIESSEVYDWYEQGTAVAPDSLDNAIYRTGSVLVDVDLSNTALDYAMRNKVQNFGADTAIGHRNDISGGGTGQLYGQLTQVTGTTSGEWRTNLTKI